MKTIKPILLTVLVLGLTFIFFPRKNEVAAPAITQSAPVVTQAKTYRARDAQAKLEQKQLHVAAPAPEAFAERFALFNKYVHKVLKTEEEAKLYKDILLDEASQTEALGKLNAKTAEDERLNLVNYLAESMEAEAGANQEALNEKVYAFLAQGVELKDMPKPMIQSLAADRIELFVILRLLRPDLAQRLSESPGSELNRRIFHYAIANYPAKKG